MNVEIGSGAKSFFYFINFSHLNIKTDIKFQKNDN